MLHTSVTKPVSDAPNKHLVYHHCQSQTFLNVCPYVKTFDFVAPKAGGVAGSDPVLLGYRIA
jgi:hypothetical protein